MATSLSKGRIAAGRGILGNLRTPFKGGLKTLLQLNDEGRLQKILYGNNVMLKYVRMLYLTCCVSWWEWREAICQL